MGVGIKYVHKILTQHLKLVSARCVPHLPTEQQKATSVKITKVFNNTRTLTIAAFRKCSPKMKPAFIALSLKDMSVISSGCLIKIVQSL